MREEFLKKIAEIISENNHIPVENIRIDSSFEDLGMDSLDGITLINDLEKHYNLAVPNVDAVKIRTVLEAIENLEALYSEQKIA